MVSIWVAYPALAFWVGNVAVALSTRIGSVGGTAGFCIFFYGTDNGQLGRISERRSELFGHNISSACTETSTIPLSI